MERELYGRLESRRGRGPGVRRGQDHDRYKLRKVATCPAVIGVGGRRGNSGRMNLHEKRVGVCQKRERVTRVNRDRAGAERKGKLVVNRALGQDNQAG